MKNITFSADENLIEAARQRAQANRTTLNAEFRGWLAGYARPRLRADEARAVLQDLRMRVRSGGRKLTRGETNEG